MKGSYGDMDMFEKFRGKKVLVTGHTGFKGSWLSLWLAQLGADVVGASIGVPTKPSNYLASNVKKYVDNKVVDIRNLNELETLISKVKPDYVFHLAAQALVRESYINPIDTMLTNSIGTANLLESLRKIDKKVIAIIITSDKAYANLEWSWGYREIDILGGKDPYSASKGMAEFAIKAFCNSFFMSNNSNISIGITRAGNVIGGGDWAKDRIVPDCVSSWAKNKSVEIRNPYATRPWQHVLEPLSGYLSFASALDSDKNLNGEAFNFGPDSKYNISVKELIQLMSKYWINVKWTDISEKKNSYSEAGLLKLNCDKALAELNWSPVLSFKETVEFTIDWYKSYYSNSKSMEKFSMHQIERYVELASERWK